MRAFHADAEDRPFLPPVLTQRKGQAIVHDPIANKGTGEAGVVQRTTAADHPSRTPIPRPPCPAFPLSERERLRIRGLVPPRQLSLETQVAKIMQNLHGGEFPTDLEKHGFLAGLGDRNETLFYRVLVDHIEELAPLIYTPTVGQACTSFSSQYRRTRGMYLSTDDVGEMGPIMHNWPYDDVQIVVVTDGSRILGLGDLGVNGMGIPIGKLSLYVAAGGIDPRRTLPIMLDAGTDNPALLKDPYYLGKQHKRLRGQAYFDMVHEMMESVYARWPGALVQFEDFASDHAQTLLDRYRHRHLCFNDDIQGTGATTLAGLMCSLRHVDPAQQPAALGEQRIVVVGAGSAGLGVASAVMKGMVQEGLTEEQAAARFYVLDADGLLGKDRDPDTVPPAAKPFLRADLPTQGLASVVDSVKPTILLGLTGVPGVFTEGIIRSMAAGVPTPIIFPLSNPTDRAECTAEQAYTWTDGKAVFASGSPFDPVPHPTQPGVMKSPSQANNMFIFPGVGLGATLVQARSVSDAMFHAAAQELANSVPEEDLAQGMVFPRVQGIREASKRVAAAVMRSALDDGIARRTPKRTGVRDLQQYVAGHMWDPLYQPLYNHVYR